VHRKALPSAGAPHRRVRVVFRALRDVLRGAAGRPPASGLFHQAGVLEALQASSRSIGGGRSRTAMRQTLLTVEIVATVVLLVAAGLLLQKLRPLAVRQHWLCDRPCAHHVLQPSEGKIRYGGEDHRFQRSSARPRASLVGVRSVGLERRLPEAGDGEGDFSTFRASTHPPNQPGANRTFRASAFAPIQITSRLYDTFSEWTLFH